MKKLGNVLKGIALGLLAFLILANGILLGKRLLTHQVQPTVCGWSWAEVLSGSMEPAISAGDLIVFHRQQAYEPGDIITYVDGAHGVTHRIIAATPDGFLTQGDSNNTPDADPVEAHQVVGKVVLILPQAGRLLSFLRTPAGLALLLILGAAIIEIPNYLNRRKEATEKKEAAEHER